MRYQVTIVVYFSFLSILSGCEDVKWKPQTVIQSSNKSKNICINSTYFHFEALYQFPKHFMHPKLYIVHRSHIKRHEKLKRCLTIYYKSDKWAISLIFFNFISQTCFVHLYRRMKNTRMKKTKEKDRKETETLSFYLALCLFMAFPINLHLVWVWVMYDINLFVFESFALKGATKQIILVQHFVCLGIFS